MRSLPHAKKFRIGLAVVTLASAFGLAFALPGSAQDTVACVRVSVSDDGQVVLESLITPPPCPEGYTQGDDQAPPADPTTTTTIAATTTTPAPAPDAETTTTTVVPAETTTTTVATSEVTEEAPPAKAVEGEPTYTG